MAKKTIPKQLKKNISNYIGILKADKLPIKQVFLFGSYAKGNQNKWSDVDICVISPKFKDAYSAMQYLFAKAPFDKKYTIEPIGFSPEDFKTNDSLISEIKRTGIEVMV